MNDYAAITVDHGFLENGYWNPTRSQCFRGDDQFTYTAGPRGANPAIEFLQKGEGLVRLENAECISTYSRTMLADYGNVLLITNASIPQHHDNVLSVAYAPSLNSTGRPWVCAAVPGPGEHCNVTEDVANAENWEQWGTSKPEI